MNDKEKALFKHDTEMLMSHFEQFTKKYGYQENIGLSHVRGTTMLNAKNEVWATRSLYHDLSIEFEK